MLFKKPSGSNSSAWVGKMPDQILSLVAISRSSLIECQKALASLAKRGETSKPRSEANNC